MMKYFFTIYSIAFLTLQTIAQVTTEQANKKTTEATATLTTNKELKDGWAKSGSFNFNITEGGLNKSWRDVRGGEEQTIGIRAIVDFDFDLKKGKSTWMNNIRARYGISKIASNGQGFQKMDDYLNYTSIYGREIKKNWSLAFMFNMNTQFDRFFLSPGELRFGPGFLHRPNEHFSMLISPAIANVTTKFATEQKNLALYGVEAGKTTKFGVGAFAQVKADYNISKGVSYKGFATFYSDYLNKPELIIMDWTNLFTLTVNEYLGATISVNMRYNDWEIGKLQMQHGIGVGLSYKFK